MTKADIVDVISEGTGLTKIETAAVIDGFLATVTYSLQSGNKVELRGFGTFCLRERQEKHVPNPRTGKMMHIPHRIVPDFKPSPQLKNIVEESLKESGQFISKTENENTENTENTEKSEDQLIINQTNIFSELNQNFIDDK
ncbi:HU family DNA-binding protein [bacterium]|nr:HU family DNA-binding protein [bacterium]